MKKILIYVITAGLAISILQSCGPSEEELRQQAEAERQARQDSLERVWQAEIEQMQRDSIEQARQDSIALAEQSALEASLDEEEELQMAEAPQIEFRENGNFTVQVRSWRSEDKAEEHADMWRDRGFEHVYTEKYGDEEIGDVWFRVRLGKIATHDMAKRLQEKIREEYNTDSWIGSVASN
jgi:septal ring-binding cell division protein DamX